MNQSQIALKGKWALAIGTFLLFTVLTSIPNGIQGIGSLASLIIAGPFAIGAAIFSLSIIRKQEAKVEQIFYGFHTFSTALVAYLLILLNVLLRLLLLVVPGIIAAISYTLTFYILADNNDLSAKEAMKRSQQMMEGNKLQFFYMSLRFFGLALLCILTLGIGFLWLFPYIHICMASFYEDLKTNIPVE